MTCPICKSKYYDYISWSEYCWGTVEQHGYCDRCGYRIEQAYSPVIEAFYVVKRGYKLPSGEYIANNKKRASSVEYIDWLYNYLLINEFIDDEVSLYECNDADVKNGDILTNFFDYVLEIAEKQGVHVAQDAEYAFDNEQEVFVKIKDRYFKASRVFGQGSVTSVSLLNEKPDYVYVELQTKEINKIAKEKVMEKIYEVTFMEYTNCMENTVSNQAKEIGDMKYITVGEEPFLVRESELDKYSTYGGGYRSIRFVGNIMV